MSVDDTDAELRGPSGQGSGHLELPDFRVIFEASPGVELVLAPNSPHFTMLAASDERFAVTLTQRESTIGRPLFEVFADANPDNPEPSGVANLRASLETVLRTRAKHRMAVQRYDIRRPDGAWDVRYWAPLNVPVLAPDGSVRYILHHVQDVTDLVLEREATAAAERREGELWAVLESMPDGVYLGSANGLTLANGAALEQLGYAKRDKLPGDIGRLAEQLGMRDAATGSAIPIERQAFVRALAGERASQDVLVRHRVTGEDRLLRGTASPVVVAEAVVAAVMVTTDITEQVRAQDLAVTLLAESERARADAEAARARSDAVLGSIADAFYLLDRDWRFIYVNDAAVPLLQTTREALIGRTLWEAFPDVIGSPFEKPYREAMAGGRATSAEAFFPPLGAWFDVRTYPWTGGVMVHFRDISPRKATEAERERLLADTEAARRDAEAANRTKGEFLAVMSHELRTPLNAIGGYAELLEMGIHGPLTSAQRIAIERIQRSQRHLLGLITGVLDYSRLEAGTVTYRLVDVPLAEAVAEAEALVAPQLRAKGLGYAWSGAAPGLAVRADREKLLQIMLNVLSNAVKFTHAREGVPGRIEVECAVEGEGRERHVRISVLDTGDGIAPEKLEHIFQPFVQGDQRLTRKHDGIGLGLAISRDLARGMGGDLVAESTVGQGSKLTLTLPCGEAT